MSKTVTKRNNKRSFVVDINHADNLAIMSDEELDNLDKRLNMEREKVVASNGDSRRLEEELCYVQREREMRQIRKSRHEAWLKEFRQQFEFADEYEMN